MTNRSASRLPANPPDEEPRDLFHAMRSGLISVDISTKDFQDQSEKPSMVTSQLQLELQELKTDLDNEAISKARLDAMNSRLLEVIRELKTAGDATAEAVEECCRQNGFWLVRMFRQLVEMVRQWHSAKAITSETSPIGPEG